MEVLTEFCEEFGCELTALIGENGDRASVAGNDEYEESTAYFFSCYTRERRGFNPACE